MFLSNQIVFCSRCYFPSLVEGGLQRPLGQAACGNDPRILGRCGSATEGQSKLTSEVYFEDHLGSRSNLGYTVVLQFNVCIDTRNESLPRDDLVSFG